MKRKAILFAVSTAITLNSFQAAFAAAAPNVTKQTASEITDAELEEIAKAAKNDTVADLTRTLGEVQTLITKVKTLNTANETDTYLKMAGYVDLVLISISAYTMHAHVKSSNATNIRLSVNVASLLLHKMSQIYKEKHKLDAKDLGSAIFETSNQVSKMDAMPSEILELKQELNQMSTQLLANKGMIENAAGKMDVGDNIALGVSALYLILHLAYPKAALEAQGVLKVILPKVHESIAKATQVGKQKTAAYGSAMSYGLPDMVRLAAGITSEESQEIVNRTLINLDTTAAKISSKIHQEKLNLKIK